MSKARHYLAAALRNLSRNRFNAAISLLGLAAGFTAALLIGLYVQSELYGDRWIQDHDRTYLVSLGQAGLNVFRNEKHRLAGGPRFATYEEDAGQLQAEVPAIEAATGIVSEEVGLASSRTEGTEKIYWADANLLNVLSMPVVAGDPRTALQRPDGIVLTRSVAEKYFGRDTPLGETLTINRRQPMRVTAVIEDLPRATHLDTRIFAAGNPSERRQAFRTARVGGLLIYAKLRRHFSIEEARSQLHAYSLRHGDFPKKDYLLYNVADLYLTPSSYRPMTPAGSLAALRVLIATALLILAVAAFNFVNLMTALATRRAAEVGIRKAAGATRSNLVVQFIGESVLYVVLAALLAVSLTELALPAFNALLDQQLALRDARPPLIGMALVAVLMTGVLGGIYPAFVLAAFNPAKTLKGHIGHGGRPGLVRQGLALAQFSVLIGLTIVSLTIFRQIDYATGAALRFDTDQVLLVDTACLPAFRNEVAALPGVAALACSRAAPGRMDGRGRTVLADGKEFQTNFVSAGFLELYGLKPLAGRFFNRARDGELPPAGSLTKVVLNETAVREFGFASPAAAIGQFIPSLSPNEVEVIGVAPDFSDTSVRQPVDSTVFTFGPDFLFMSIKLTGDSIPGTLQALSRTWNRAGDRPNPIQYRFVDEYIQQLYADTIRQGRLLAFFAAIASLIACMGLFTSAVLAAAQRAPEIGIRKALGAQRSHIVRMLLWQFARPVVLANFIAWPAAGILMHRWLQGFAYRVDLEAWVFASASSLALLIAMLTVAAQAWRSARTRPIVALRYE